MHKKTLIKVHHHLSHYFQVDLIPSCKGDPIDDRSPGLYWFLKSEAALIKLLRVNINSPVTYHEGGDSDPEE